MQKRDIHLPPPERDQLIALVSQGHHPANVIKRAYMLLHSDTGFKDETIAQLLFSSEDSVRRVRIRYLNEGLEAALHDRPRPGRTLALNAQQEAYLIALACTEPPSGQEHWTLELLAQRMVADEQVEELSPETVRLTLKKTNSNLGA